MERWWDGSFINIATTTFMRDKEKQKQWTRENYKRIVGFRPTKMFRVYRDDLSSMIPIDSVDFLVGTFKKPLTVYGTNVKVHVPRSLCRRERLLVNINTGTIVSKGKMNYANL